MQSRKQAPAQGKKTTRLASVISQLTFKDVLFVLALATKPLYFLSSGSLQISDLLFMILFGLLIFDRVPIFQSREEERWIGWFSICLIYQLCVNFIAYYQIQLNSMADSSLLRSNLYYFFNYLVCITILQFRSLRGFTITLRLYLFGTALSVVIALLGVLLNYKGSGRATGFFNNPNQLGYFAIVSLTAVTFFAKNLRPHVRFTLAVLCLSLSMISLSKACILSSSILLFAYFINSRNRVGRAKLISVLLSITVIAVIIYVIFYSNWEFLNDKKLILSLRRRMGSLTTENDSSLGASRGYDRIREIKGWILVGVGEGANKRFTVMSGREVHSLYASFLVSYGVIGFSLLARCASIALFSEKRYTRNLLCFSGVLLYCVTHNGIRNTLVWALLTMLIIRPPRDAFPEEIADTTNALNKRPSL